MPITKQDLLTWFSDLFYKSAKTKVFTQLADGENSNIKGDQEKALLVAYILSKYDKPIIEMPSAKHLKIFKEIAEQCASNSFKSINVATKKRREAIIGIFEYLRKILS